MNPRLPLNAENFKTYWFLKEESAVWLLWILKHYLDYIYAT